MYVVGSFCRGNPHKESDIDILLYVNKRNGFDDESFTELNRKKTRDYFAKNGIKSKCDYIHPMYKGRRIDIYFTFNKRTSDCIRIV